MAVDVTKLEIRVDSKQVGMATQRIDVFIHAAGRAERSVKSLGRSIVTHTAVVVALYKAYQALTDTVRKVAVYEKLGKQLEFLTGSAEAAAEELEYLKALSQEHALVTEKMVGPYTRMSVAMSKLGMNTDDIRDLFEAVAGGAATFSMSVDEVEGILRALAQMASKGKVSAEELRSQLGERLLCALKLAELATGKTSDELEKMMEQGQLMALDFLPKFSSEMEKAFGVTWSTRQTPSVQLGAGLVRPQHNTSCSLLSLSTPDLS